MVIPNTRCRGLSSIKTSTTPKAALLRPYLAFLRIGALEIEMERRVRDRDKSLQRARQLNARCLELEMEKDLLLRSAGERGGIDPDDAESPAKSALVSRARKEPPLRSEPAEAPEGKDSGIITPTERSRSASSGPGGFKIRY